MIAFQDDARAIRHVEPAAFSILDDVPRALTMRLFNSCCVRQFGSADNESLRSHVKYIALTIMYAFLMTERTVNVVATSDVERKQHKIRIRKFTLDAIQGTQLRRLRITTSDLATYGLIREANRAANGLSVNETAALVDNMRRATTLSETLYGFIPLEDEKANLEPHADLLAFYDGGPPVAEPLQLASVNTDGSLKLSDLLKKRPRGDDAPVQPSSATGSREDAQRELPLSEQLQKRSHSLARETS